MSFSEVNDVYGFRIITHSEPHCYLALGTVHGLYRPRPGRFKDHIALPKPNGYQSLHTVLNSPFNLPVEIQIRTQEMDVLAEKGAAAHWQYKSGETTSGTAQVRAREWLMQLVEVQRHSTDSMEFLDWRKIGSVSGPDICVHTQGVRSSIYAATQPPWTSHMPSIPV